MLRISRTQFDTLSERARADQRARVLDRLAGRYPEVLRNDQAPVSELLDQLFGHGFVDEEQQHGAALLLLGIAQRDDPGAAEARALADAILFAADHEPQARIAFVRAQRLATPPPRD